MAACPHCRQQLAALGGELLLWEDACATVQDVLPWYVEVELLGGRGAEAYPLVAAHLETCSACAHALADLRFALGAAGLQPEPVRYPPLALPFLVSIPQAGALADWSVDVVRRTARELVLLVSVSRQYIQTVITPASMQWARSGEARSSAQGDMKILPLLANLVEDESLLVTIELQRDPSAGAEAPWDILLTLSTLDSPRTIKITASDGIQVRTAMTNAAGEALLRSVPAAWLAAPARSVESSNLEIEIAVRDCGDRSA